MRRSSRTMASFPRAALLGLGLLLGACAPMGQDYQRPGAVLPSAWNEVPRDAAGTERIAAVWWKVFGDRTLGALIASAGERNADARIALAQLDEAQAVLREAHASLFPQIDLGGSASRSRITTLGATPLPATVPAARSDFRLAASTAFELDFWGRLRRAEEAARAQMLGSRYAREVTALSISASTAQAYFLLRALDAQTLVAMATLGLREESLAIARARQRAGVASGLELHQAEGAVADAKAQVIELRRQRRQTQHALALLAGQPGLDLSAAGLDTIAVPPMPPAGLPSTLLERRPDVRAAEQALIAANARVGVARAAMMPTISLTGALGGQSRELSDLLLPGARIWSLGFGLTLPLFDAGRLEARAEQAEARRRQALAGYQKAAESAYREVADALSGVSASVQAESEARVRVQAASGSVRLARLRWEAGHSPYLEVLDAQRTLNEAELGLVRTRQSSLVFMVELIKALGGGWTETD